MIGKYGAVAMLFLAGLAALYPQPVAWAYVVAFMVFEFWLLRRLNAEGRAPAATDEAPYHFTGEEAQFIGRYRFYFAYPELARGAASTLAAMGLAALVLSPWLVFRGHLVPAFLIALNLLAVGSLTKRLAPELVLRIAANKGDRAALRMLELHDPLWAKIRAANAKE
jgi:putative Ca2+/H+ antiporter (TMEM165/GDT1 family)